MPLLLYGGPKKAKKRSSRKGPSLDFEELENTAAATKKWIHPRLRFEEIVKNNTLPPCSLNDFMDYLVYVEGEAETLQFFLWYCDYIERWMALPSAERGAAPKWDPENKRPVTSHSRNGSLKEKVKLGAILDILDTETKGNSARPQRRRNDSVATNFSLPRTPEPVELSRDAGEKKPVGWEPFSTQPYREEINQIVRHYITTGSPRQLHLSAHDRAACIHAAEHTTHPSALLPAFISAEAVLRGRLHPRFISWSISNGNRALVVLERLLSALTLVLALGTDVLLILSDWPRLWRLVCAPLWFFGFAGLIASAAGVCAVLHLRGVRQLRPWEQASDLEAGQYNFSRKHLRKNTSDSVMSYVDPLRKESLRALGAGNDFAGEEWVASYRRRWLFRRVFDATVPVQNRQLAVLQGGVIAGAVFWASLIAMVITAGSVFVPSLSFVLA